MFCTRLLRNVAIGTNDAARGRDDAKQIQDALQGLQGKGRRSKGGEGLEKVRRWCKTEAQEARVHG